MKGKTVVMTGATSGIGEEAAQALAGKGARIVFVARDEARAKATLQKIERAGPGLGHGFHLADLSSMADTKRVGREIAAREPKVDVLVNNAGAMFSDRRVTAEGLEMTFALNHMAYFLMTEALAPSLAAAAPARIVSTASAAHIGMTLDLADLQGAKSFSGWRAYGRSKLANILFTREAARRLAQKVTVNCFHPGVVATRFGSASGGWAGRLFPLLRPFFIGPEKGADTLVWLASAPEAAGKTGGYFVKRKAVEPSAGGRDDAAAKGLWAASEALAASA